MRFEFFGAVRQVCRPLSPLVQECPGRLPWCHQSTRSLKLKPPGKRSHYDALGVTPSATQTDIKNAYYKLSKLYHPDRNKGSEDAAEHFRSISEAYEILGNFKRRRMYDRGIPGGSSSTYTGPSGNEGAEEFADDPTSRFYKSRGQGPTGKTPIYDFDEWSRSHYGASFRRKEKAKNKYETKMRRDLGRTQDMQKESIIYGAIFVVCLIMFMHIIRDSGNNDVDKTSKRKDSKNP